jgi:hypothetical protein
LNQTFATCEALDWVRQEFRTGYRDATFKSHSDAVKRACIHATILAFAIFYPAALWKRIVGALLAFFLVGVIIQFPAVRSRRTGEVNTAFTVAFVVFALLLAVG